MVSLPAKQTGSCVRPNAPIIPGMDNSFAALDSPPPGSGRRYPRYPVQIPIAVTVAEEGAGREAGDSEPPLSTVSLHDISLTGFYFTSPRAYPIDSPIELHVALAGQSFRIKAMVQRSKAAQDGPQAAHGTAVLFVRGGDIHPFLAAVAAHLHRWPHAESAAAEGVAPETRG